MMEDRSTRTLDENTNLEEQQQQEGVLFSHRCKTLKRIFALLSSLKSTNQCRFSSLNPNLNASILTTSNDLLSSQNMARRAILLTSATDNLKKRNKETIADIFVKSNRLNMHTHGASEESQATVNLGVGVFNNYCACEESHKDNNEGILNAGGSFSINLIMI